MQLQKLGRKVQLVLLYNVKLEALESI